MKKTAHYRYAAWFNEGHALEPILRECLEAVADEIAPDFDVWGDQRCTIARRPAGDGELFLHMVTYEQGAPAAVIEAALAGRERQTDTESPPDGKEYIQSQVFLLIRGNDVVWTTHNSTLREGRITALLHRFIDSHSEDEEYRQFALQARVDREVFRRAFATGIEEIDLDIGGFRETLDHLVRNGQIPGMNPLMALVGRRLTPEEIEAAEHLIGRLSLKPGRDWKMPQVKALTADMATSLLDSDEDGQFAIVLKNGFRLTRDRMSVKRSYSAEGNKHVLSPVDVQAKLTSAMDELFESGVLEG
ncbi:hypothetical protein [Oceanicaulis sp. MMSF_3324]|uniref:hypothetical protein n=1 Tax=Oceanicaulis sp. MMSF_3324 TaxID=3046702 RepID=UPI00273ED78E|nr:hypothetical protein [Oceanicaulis sp. MMSF_3324]